MADTLTLRSPLQSWESRFTALPETTTISEEPFVAMVDLWVDPSGPGGAAAAGSARCRRAADHPIHGGRGSGHDAHLVRAAGMAGDLQRSQR